jgi:xylulokinase
LSTKAAGTKVAWVADNEPETFARACRLFVPSSWLVLKLTGEYVLDQHSASQCTPLYDTEKREWYQPWVDLVAPGLSLPPLRWPGEVAGVITREAAALTGLPVDIPVITGTIDAWAEATSVGAQGVGDLMLMYGSGAITSWLRELFGSLDYAELINLGERSGPGANGLLMLPYFVWERTPVMDPEACGVIAGLTLSHTHGDLCRAALEAIGLGERHNIETIEEAGGDIRRIFAVGGGTQGTLWTQIVSDITARPQEIPSQTIGASYGGIPGSTNGRRVLNQGLEPGQGDPRTTLGARRKVRRALRVVPRSLHHHARHRTGSRSPTGTLMTCTGKPRGASR